MGFHACSFPGLQELLCLPPQNGGGWDGGRKEHSDFVLDLSVWMSVQLCKNVWHFHLMQLRS